MKEQTEMDPLKSESVLKKVTQMIARYILEKTLVHLCKSATN